FQRLQRLAGLVRDQLQRLGIEPARLERGEKLLQLELCLAAAGRLQQSPAVESALQRAGQAAKIEAQRRLAQDAGELVGPPLHQRLGERRHLPEQARDFFELEVIELFGIERIEQRALQPFDQVLRAGEVELEEAIE